MALSELTRQEILQAIQEYDRLGREAFLDKYGFGQARLYLLVHDGKTYDSKAIVGAAHGFLPGRSALTAADFSGGAATVGRLLANLGFEVRTDASTTLTTTQLLDKIAGLRLYHSPDGHAALYQPITLLWAIGRALRELPRTASWTQTQNELNPLLERHGEHPRAPYPLGALYHAGLWDLDGPRPVPPAHGNAPFDWFAEHQPSSGLALDVYNLVRYSGEARVAAVDAIVEQYLQNADVDALLRDVGLAGQEIARDQAPAEEVTLPVSPAEEQYRRLCGIADRALELGARLRKARVSFDYMRLGSSRQAVLIRSEGHCENPRCTGEPQDITDTGEPILEVDHIHDLALGGPDHPAQMIALCPNCHAIKTRGQTREQLRQQLFNVAGRRHDSLLSR